MNLIVCNVCLWIYFLFTVIIGSLNIEHLATKFLGYAPFLCMYFSGTPFGSLSRFNVDNIPYPFFPMLSNMLLTEK